MQTAAAYWQLTKPRIVLLLVFTTFTAMGVADRGFHFAFSVLAATLLGGWLSAAGASALNQYLDRDMDAQMARTRSRPIPAGRVKPGWALAFGLALVAASAVILGFLVNWLAAGLAMAGVAYYAGFYTLVLKRNTALNVIIGG
ncbi:MAG TPA: UbiA family prenyltransferase, partial [Anaerolineaceae bacterium]